MLIRCPECTFTRQVNENKIPAGSEFATCPKCKKRFRFRTVTPDEQTAGSGAKNHPSQQDAAAKAKSALETTIPHERTEKTDSGSAPEREAVSGPDGAPGNDSENTRNNRAAKDKSEDDVWSAVEDLNEQWESRRPGEENRPDRDDHGGFESYEPDEQRREQPDENIAGPEDANRRARQAYQNQTPEGQGQKQSHLADSGSVPWEYKGGFLNPQAFVRTIILSFTRIPEFFGGIPARGSLLPAMTFTLVMRAVQFVMAFMFLKLTVLNPEGETVTITLSEIVNISIPQIVITILFIVILMQFASAWVVNFMVKIINRHASFSLTFKVVSYSLSPLIFTLIPNQVGMIAAEIGCLTLFTLGLRHAYRLSWKKTMMVLIPLMLLMFLINISGSVFMMAG